jgi:hypothetical protein
LVSSLFFLYKRNVRILTNLCMENRCIDQTERNNKDVNIYRILPNKNIMSCKG